MSWRCRWRLSWVLCGSLLVGTMAQTGQASMEGDGCRPTPSYGHPSRGDLLQEEILRAIYLDKHMLHSRDRSPLEGWRAATGWVSNAKHSPKFLTCSSTQAAEHKTLKLFLKSAEENATTDAETEPRPYNPIRPPMECPADVETLTTLMIRDIPSYTNRVLQRTSAVLEWTEADELRLAAGELVRQPYRPSHVLVAGQVNLEPLDLAEYTYTTSPEAGGPIEQVFFTTRSRQYSQRPFGNVSVEEVEEFHWAFLTQTTGGWRLAFMFSSLDDVNDSQASLPPRENSRGSIGQAVQLWLRDCRAGAIRQLEQPSEL